MALIRLEEGERVWKLRHTVVIADSARPPLWLRVLHWICY